MDDRPAATIARALARTSVYYKRSALLAGLIGLAAVIGALLTAEVVPKGGLLGVGVLFAVFCYRSLRASTRYTDPKASPVLRAIVETPERIAKVWVEHDSGKPCYVIIQDDGGAKLPVRIESAHAAAQVPPLLAAFQTRSPDAEVVR